MSISLTTSDIQFLGNDPTTQKLRRLVQDLVAAEKAINTLINQVTTLQGEIGSTGTEVLATTEGLGPNFTVSGLTEGQVLKALSATSAAFAKLSLSDLSNVLIENGQNGQVLTFINNQWVNENPAAGPSAPQGQNQGTGIDIYAGLSGGNLVFNSITGDGSSINVDIVGDTIVVSFIGTSGGNGVIGMQGPPGFEADPEPGEPGPPGQIGPQGLQGATGPTGGTTVFQYLMVDNPDAGDQGDPGPPGQIGQQGIPGTNGTGAATYFLIDSDAGADGEPGPPGISAAPANAVATIGAAVSLTSGSTQSVPANTTTPINFNNTLFDTGSYYSGGNPSRFTVPATGLYLVHASICWDSPGLGERMLFICKNGNYSVQYAANVIPGGAVTTGYNPACSTSCVMSLAAGDYIEACAYQDTGGAINVIGVNSFWTTFSIRN